LVVSDLHLPVGPTTHLDSDFRAAIAEHPERELVLAGDTFDLSGLPHNADGLEALSPLLGAHPVVRLELLHRLERGAPVTVIPGNHDSALLHPDAREALTAALGVGTEAPLRLAPWFHRWGDVHLEHGHLYDPDNAPNHPLVPWSDATEPLGVALTRRYLVPRRAHGWVHRHETTPLRGLLDAMRQFGPRAPGFVGAYFWVALGLCVDSLRSSQHAAQRDQGRRELARLVQRVGLTQEALERLLSEAPRPTHQRLGRTFRRLYLDRAGSTAALLAAGTGQLLGTPGSSQLAMAAAVALAVSLYGGVNRYGGRIETKLAEGAAMVRALTDARLVVFGHSHRAESAPGYVNCGSFAFPGLERRSVLLIDSAEEWTRFGI